MKVQIDVHPRADECLHQAKRIVDDFIEMEGRFLLHLLAAECQQLSRELRRSPAGALDFFHVRAPLVVLRHGLLTRSA